MHPSLHQLADCYDYFLFNAQEHIQSKLKSLKDERERLQGLKVMGEKRSQKHLVGPHHRCMHRGDF